MGKNSHNNLMHEKIMFTGLTLISALETAHLWCLIFYHSNYTFF